LITEEQYRAVQAEFSSPGRRGRNRRDLKKKKLFAPTAPETPSTRRKAAPGMVLEAAEAFGEDLAGSYFNGDKCAGGDVEMRVPPRRYSATIQGA
jgi:hypothetical protein